MKTLVFSDTHLTHKFDLKKFNFLKTIIQDSDRVVINGDFWDGYLTSFNSFVDSPWNQLFPLLKSKNAVYIHGNHDPQKYCNEKVKLFSVASNNEFHLKSKKVSFVFTHGHSLLKNKRSPMVNLYIRFLDFIEERPVSRSIHQILNVIGSVGLRIIGPNSISKLRIINESNRIMKSTNKPTSGNWLVCGDSHIPELDTVNLYANSGFIQQGNASYLTITGDTIKLIRQKY